VAYQRQIKEDKVRDIKVTYDGEYPSTCRGTLTIVVDGKQIYSKQSCSSSVSVWFDGDWNDYVETGELTWADDEAEKFPKDVQNAVKEVLSEYHVCCGGCV
jgi:hypothetical protein